jgi:DNA-binding transcriptional MerR regulator
MKKTNEDLDRRLAAFKRATLEDFFTLSSFLRSEGISLEELKGYLEWKTRQIAENKAKFRRLESEKMKEAKKQFAKWQERVKRCPKCDSPLTLSRVSTPKGKANKEGWRSLWGCTNEKCQFEEYSKEFADKIYTEIMED